MNQKPNATFFCSLRLDGANKNGKPLRIFEEERNVEAIGNILIDLYRTYLLGRENESTEQVRDLYKIEELILFSLKNRQIIIDQNLVRFEIESFELRRGSVILEFTLLLFTAGVSNYDTYASMADKALSFIGLDFKNMGFDVKKNFFSLDNEAYQHYTPNHNEIIQTVTTQLQEFEKKFFQDLGDRLTIVRLLVVFLFMGLIGTFTIYSQKSELEDSLKIRKEISEYLNDLNLLKESGIKVPEDSLKAIEKKPKSRIPSAF